MKKTRNVQLVSKKTRAGINKIPFPFDINTCKQSFATRNVDLANVTTLLCGTIKPKAGDLVVCEVTRLRQHCRIEQPNGRRSRMFIGDKIIVAYGDRYAPDQFESIVPNNLDACHLVAGGGIASLMRHKSPKVKPATEIQPLGLLGDKLGRVINLKDYSLIPSSRNNSTTQAAPPVLLVAGSSMNAGKTTTVASVIKGLKSDDYKVAAAKVTGTGSGGDLWHFIDAGVDFAIDFTDAGFATTYLVSNKVLVKVFADMINYLKSKDVDVIVVEVADGILQKESKALLATTAIQNSTTAMIYTSGDSSSALFGTNWLLQQGYNVLGISGVVSSNPLGSLEIVQNITVPLLKKSEITAAGFGHSLMETLRRKEKILDMKVAQ